MRLTLGRSSNVAPPLQDRSVALAMGCAGLFLLPFGAVGLVTAALGVQRLIRGNLREAGVFLLFGVVFGGVATAGWTMLLIGRRKQQEQEKLRARNPEQPWMWRPDWASKRISDSGRSNLWGSWIFATLWNLISFPTGFLAFRSARLEGNTPAYAGLLFPLVGSGLLFWAVRNTLRYRKYGISTLELSTLPGVIGHRLAGQVRASTLLQSAGSFGLTLSCIERVTTGSGDNRSTTERILWQEEQQVRGVPSRDSSGMFTRVPVGFRLPADVRPSDNKSPSDEILWRLTVTAELPGVDYASAFEVPVFRTPESELPATGEDLELARTDIQPYRQPGSSRISVQRTMRGTEISFPAARAPGAATFLTFFTIIWGAIAAALLHFRAPLLFPVVFALFGLLLLIGVLQLWLFVSRVTVQKGSITIAQGYLVAGSERTIALGEISDITTRIDMQMGSRPYYDIAVLTRNGKKIAAGRWLRDKREAEWLAATMKEGLGLGSISPAEPDSRMPLSSTGS